MKSSSSAFLLFFLFITGLRAEEPAAPADPHAPFRPACVPLVVSDPFLSIWSWGDKLAGQNTQHWTGTEQPLSCLVRIDGQPFRLMGIDPRSLPAMPQTGVQVTPTRSIYDFDDRHVHITLTFMTPVLPDSLEIMTRPVTYLTWAVRSLDGQPHQVAIFEATSSLVAVDHNDQKVVWSRETMGDLTALKVGTRDQTLLYPAGDDARIDWGYAYAAAPSAGAQAAIAGYGRLLDGFVDDGTIPGQDDTRMPRGAYDDTPALAFLFDLGPVGADTVTRHLMIAYDEIDGIAFNGRRLPPYWKRNGATAPDLLQAAEKDYPSLVTRCETFDRDLLADLTQVGGKRYAQLGAMAYRQAIGGTGIVADQNKKPLLFTKENSSDGNVDTVDVVFPMEPIFLALSPVLAKASLVPILDYAGSSKWKFPNAPHDVGPSYPIADASGDGGEAMPVEESGNMLILCDAIAKIDGNADFSAPWWPQLTQWAHYLEQYGLDPESQLCTDDFMGHLAHNSNLSVKAIVALAAYGDMCRMRGDKAGADKYLHLAKADAAHWTEAAAEGDHYKLAFDKPKTWSQKYNLVYDRLLGLNVFPPEVAAKEIAYYKKHINRYGLPMDSRTTRIKPDETMMVVTMARDPDDFEGFVSPMYDYFNQTTSHAPLVDLYDSLDLGSSGFRARPVVGDFFIRMLADPAIWKKWANAADGQGMTGWAPLPAAPQITYVFPATATEPMPWRYTLAAPAATWMRPGFDDSAWNQGEGGFGTVGPVHSPWKTDDIWMRTTFTMPAGSFDDLHLMVFHDEDVEVYVNGLPAFSAPKFNKVAESFPINPAARALLQPGASITLAVHCHQTILGQGIDVRLVNIASDSP